MMLFVRADSNTEISGGHIMRCLSIAKCYMESGKRACFLVADDNPTKVLEEANMPYIVLNSDWRNLMSDVEQVKDIIKVESNAVLLIDTYSITREYVEQFNGVCRVAYLGSKKEYFGQLDTLVNYSSDIDYEFYNEKYGIDTKLLLGISYAPLRMEFQNVVHNYKSRIERVLLTTGQTERNQMVERILDAISNILGNVYIDVIVGRMFDNKSYLINKYKSNSYIWLHENVQDISRIMNKCDLAISANGTTVYELSALGIPTISFAMVEEQERSAKALERLGIVDYSGSSFDKPSECADLIKRKVEFYLYHNDELISMARKAHDLIDGNGCFKIVRALE